VCPAAQQQAATCFSKTIAEAMLKINFFRRCCGIQNRVSNPAAPLGLTKVHYFSKAKSFRPNFFTTASHKSFPVIEYVFPKTSTCISADAAYAAAYTAYAAARKDVLRRCADIVREVMPSISIECVI